MPRKPLPLHRVRKARNVTLSDVEYYPVDYINRTCKLGNESEALRLILDEYAKMKGIQTSPSPTLAERQPQA
jgi:hypothetical protein